MVRIDSFPHSFLGILSFSTVKTAPAEGQEL
jgi:hypothetical protein